LLQEVRREDNENPMPNPIDNDTGKKPEEPEPVKQPEEPVEPTKPKGPAPLLDGGVKNCNKNDSKVIKANARAGFEDSLENPVKNGKISAARRE